MSHELRTPLASIQLASDMLKKYGDRATEAEKQKSIEAIETQVQYLSELVKDVLTISKTEFMAQDIDLEVYDLETYLRDIIEELEWTYRKTHRLVFNGVNRRVEVRIDRKLLRHAIVNLLTNAIKYSPDGGEVCIDLECVSNEAVIRVSDQGIGIPTEDLPRLFEAFHRAGNVRILGDRPGIGNSETGSLAAWWQHECRKSTWRWHDIYHSPAASHQRKNHYTLILTHAPHIWFPLTFELFPAGDNERPAR